MDAMKSPAFFPRHLTAQLVRALSETPVVCLLGPRQSGKTTLVRTLSRAYVSLDDENLLRTAKQDPAGFVGALPDPVTIDEVQLAPALLRAIKVSVDNDRRAGRFLLTGSANLLLLPKLSESLAGRMEVLHLQPFCEAEKERQPGGFLGAFLRGEIAPAILGGDEVPITGIAARMVAGGYPEPFGRTPAGAARWHRNYLTSIIARDISQIARVRDAREVSRLLELLSHRTAALLNVSGLGGDLGHDRKTVEHYLAILERLFLLRTLPAWHRSGANRLIKASKTHLIDTGLAATLAGLREQDWNLRRDRFGCLLESFVLQQLVAQAGWTDPDLRFWHYRDKDQVEVDVVITRGEETWGVEVKASATTASSDARGLRRFAELAGPRFRGGALFYSGSSTLPTSDPRILAIPLSRLWDM